MKGKIVQEILPVLGRTPYRSWLSLLLFQNKWVLGHREEGSWERQGWKLGHARSTVKLQPEDRLKEQRGQDCWVMTADMLVYQKMSRSSSKGPAPTPKGFSAGWGSQPGCLLDAQVRLWQFRACSIFNVYAAALVSIGQGSTSCLGPSLAQLNVSAWQPANTSHLTQHGGGEEDVVRIIASKLCEVFAWSWQIAQVSPLSMFKHYNKVSVCLRPSA